MPATYNRIPQGTDFVDNGSETTASVQTAISSKRQSQSVAATDSTKVHSSGRWGVSKNSPLSMVVLLILAMFSAVGHHLYYAKYHGTEVLGAPNTQWNLESMKNSQEWKIRIGTGLAYLTRAFAAASVVVAYEQYVWLRAQRTTMTVDGLSSMFKAPTSILGFLSGNFLRRSGMGYVLALLLWCIPLAAVVTPATLRVVPMTVSSWESQMVPTINFSHTEPLYDNTSTVRNTDWNTANNGISPYMSRHVASAASSLQILPVNFAIPNSTYHLTFNGPSFRCEKPSPTVAEATHMMANSIYAPHRRGDPLSYQYGLTWFAAPPSNLVLDLIARTPVSESGDVFSEFTAVCYDNLSLKDHKSEFGQLCSGITGAGQRISYEQVREQLTSDTNNNWGRIWVWAQNETYECILADTKYDVTFYYSESEKKQRVDPIYSYNWTKEDLYGSYAIVGDSVAQILAGGLHRFYSSFLSVKTRVTETAIFGAFKAAPMKNDEPDPGIIGLSQKALPPEITIPAQNKSVPQLIEELSRNVTLSLFGLDNILVMQETNVTISRVINSYSYNRAALWISYGITLAVTAIASLIGGWAYWRNGVSHEVSFAAFLATTRNSYLDEKTKGDSLGRLPFSDSFKSSKLRFGLLRNESKQDGDDQAPRRIGFGHPDQVDPLPKKTPYY